MKRFAFLSILLFSFLIKGFSQYKSFKINADGDTFNIVDSKGLKQGKWVNTVGEIRGEPGYDEEGIYKDDKREGVWKRFTAEGDIVGIENYRFGGKDGVQKYFTFLGQLEREEQWHSYNPASPYDTIPVYGTGSDEILRYDIKKATQYSVPDGDWKYYDATSGALTKTIHYDRGLLTTKQPKPAANKSTGSYNDYKQQMQQTMSKANATDSTANDSTVVQPIKPKDKQKPQEILDYEKKYSKKKRKQLERTGETGL
ncbi:toxin-antitoxin system YwqK family antitoxin [Ferruginibacter albus]|uniref:hypothetical protein n=1 Tax=Ferruginibacter albus TaxID=2875540 RepID=UPI001CC55F2C|nr:hypothetical protein [Ferruginibacter albus]UAY51474.1 hypothetical protein K9M53_12855 [Ferruginibacter albus]